MRLLSFNFVFFIFLNWQDGRSHFVILLWGLCFALHDFFTLGLRQVVSVIYQLVCVFQWMVQSARHGLTGMILWLCTFRKGIIIDDVISWHKRIILLYLTFVMGSGLAKWSSSSWWVCGASGVFAPTCECRWRPRCAFFSHVGGLTCKNKFDARQIDQWLAVCTNTRIKLGIFISWCAAFPCRSDGGELINWFALMSGLCSCFGGIFTLKRNAPSLLATRAETRLTVYRAPQVGK